MIICISEIRMSIKNCIIIFFSFLRVTFIIQTELRVNHTVYSIKYDVCDAVFCNFHPHALTILPHNFTDKFG